MASSQQAVAAHFDTVAKQYDYWKQKNWFYYDALKAIARKHSRTDGRLLDVGCGTGAMVRAVGAKDSLGIDVSPEMVAVAQERNPEYRFETADITTYRSATPFDTILFFDVIEHVPDTDAALKSLVALLAPNGRLVITMANPLWEPILMVAEKLNLKMPEGPHYRVPTREFLLRAAKAGLKLEKREWRLLFPKPLPFVSWFFNDVVGRIPFIERLAVIEIFIFSKA